MSNLFNNIRKNIITNMTPLQNALKTQANFFIDTLLEDDINEEKFSDDLEDGNTNSINSDDNINSEINEDNDTDENENIDTEIYDDYNIFIQQNNIKKNKLYDAPNQQFFNDDFENLNNSIVNVYSPIAYDNKENEKKNENNLCEASVQITEIKKSEEKNIKINP